MKTIAKTSLLIFITLCFTAGASAAIFVVNTTSDTVDAALGNGACSDSNGDCSLRAAISEANALAGADIITLGAGAYTQSLSAHDENANAGGDWDIKSDITINGAGQASTIIQASTIPTCNSQGERVLEVGVGAALTLTNVTVRNGCMINVDTLPGAGIASRGVLTLTDVTVRDNIVDNLMGTGLAGGIYNGGTALTLTNTTVTANSVTGSPPSNGGFGGGIGSLSNSTITITNSSISGNQAQGNGASRAYGAGMYVDGTVNITATGSHFDQNSLSGLNNNEGGGVYVSGNAGQSIINFTGCTFNFNGAVATGSGSAVNGTGLRLTNWPVETAGLTATLDKVTINGNATSSGGRGLSVTSIGGGIGLYVNNSTISNNAGGGVTLSNNGSFSGSFVHSEFYSTTISGNTASAGAGLVTSQVSSAITVELNFCTITNNTATGSGGGINAFSGGAVNITRSVIAGNTAGTMGPDLYLFINSFDFNHIGNTSGATITGDTAHNTTGSVMLGPLQDNGGPTLTHSPLLGSPVINSIPTSSCFPNTFPFDQRGIARPQGTSCDKGAVERTVYAPGPWSLSGVVQTTTGIPIRNVAVQISGGNLPAPITVFTGNLGTYQFTNLTGDEYTVTVTAKRYHFNESQRVIGLGQNITDADFIANAPFSREELIDVPVVKGKL